MALKGTTTIELTNVKTGEVERYAETNMVTNALDALFLPIGYLKGYGPLEAFVSASMVQTVLGGMVLFDKQIPESEDQIYPPGEASAVGYGSYNYTNDTTNPVLGSYNLTESEHNHAEGYMKFVYDFTTSQGNGVINCVALTHVTAARECSYGHGAQKRPAGYAGGNPFYLWNKYPLAAGDYSGPGTLNFGYFMPFLTDFYDGSEDAFSYSFAVTDANTIKVRSYRLAVFSARVVKNYATTPLYNPSQDITITLNSPIPTGYVSWNYDHATNSLYIFTSSGSSIANKGNMIVTKISIGDWNVDQYTVPNNTGATLYTQYMYFHRGYIYTTNGSTAVYKISLEDPSNFRKMSGALLHSGQQPLYAVQDRVFFNYSSSGNYYFSVVNGALGTVDGGGCNSSQNTRLVPVHGDESHWVAPWNGLCVPNNYLATINNLARPIEKTSDKTMKITYTIQEM